MNDPTQKNANVTNLDAYQMYNRVFDGETDSFRMSLIGAKFDLTPEIKMPELSPVIIKEVEYKTIEVPQIIKEIEYKTIEIPVIVKEFQIVEKPIIIKEIEIQTIEKQVIVNEIKIIEIEKPITIIETKIEKIEVPVIIKEIQVIETKIYEMPMIAKVCMIVQSLALLGMLLTKAL